MDMEAGIEHFGRGIDNGVDLILIIIDPSYESLQLSQKIGELSESIQKPFYYVLNKVTKENQEMMYEAVWNSSRVAVSLGADPSIMGEGLMGKELSEKPDAIENLVKKFDFTTEQATAIVMLQLYRLTNTDVVILEE